MRRPDKKEAKIRRLNKERCRINGMIDEITMSVRLFKDKLETEKLTSESPSETLVEQAVDLSQKFEKSLNKYGRRLERIKSELGELTDHDVPEL